MAQSSIAVIALTAIAPAIHGLSISAPAPADTGHGARVPGMARCARSDNGQHVSARLFEEGWHNDGEGLEIFFVHSKAWSKR